MIRYLFMACLVLFSLHAKAQMQVTEQEDKSAFPIVEDQAAGIYVSPKDYIVVHKTAAFLAEDIQRVTDKQPALHFSDKVKDECAIVVGTIGHSPFIDKLIQKNLLDVSAVKGGWEQYTVQLVEHPMKGVRRALIIAGSDRRGTAYGIFSLSEVIGVSPWYWWADVPVKKRVRLMVNGSIHSTIPAVKYRGIFINDEDWGLKPWASHNFEKNLGDVGSKTYAKVCELILRLKGNMMGPAMHTCTGAFYSHPESKLVADSFAILITTSHCEPLLLNNASKTEWDTKRDGDWNYATNKETITRKWRNRLGEAAQFENIYTMGMRGLHDAGLRGNLPMEQQVTLLGQVIADQRNLLREYTKKDIREIPQIFVPYKETMDVYENGLQVPDDVTLVWVDDNFGYMKRISNPQERQRSGGAGVYYHVSYLGEPHDYLWLNTTPPVLMYEELKKAYDYGADRYWLLNVGDIKPSELAMSTFFDMAWNMKAYTYERVYAQQAEFLASLFGQQYQADFQHLLDEHYRLAWSRKPEFMGWEREWDKPPYTGLKDTEYSFDHYQEAQCRLADYQAISETVKQLEDRMPKALRPSFFQLLGYPIRAACQMNRKFLMAQLNHEQYEKKNYAEANWAAAEAKASYDSIADLNRQFNQQLDGKWNGMMDLPPGWCALYQNMPEVHTAAGMEARPVSLACSQPDSLTGCHVVNLTDFAQRAEQGGNGISLINGLGYDGKVVQLGEPSDKSGNTGKEQLSQIDYLLPTISSDTVEVMVYSLPFFPLYKGKVTRIGLAIDGGKMQILDNSFKEYSKLWKDQVLRNSAIGKVSFHIDSRLPQHTLSLFCIDAGMMVQKIILNWGGLQKSYLGPSVQCSKNSHEN